MLNLRQLNNTDNAETNSDAQHFSRFSINFRVPSDLLGDIGEPLDHSQSERIHEYDACEREVTAERSEAGTGADFESIRLVAGLSQPSQAGARWEDEGRAPASTAGASAGPSLTRCDDSKRACIECTVPNAGTSRTRGDEVGDVSHAPDHVDGADTGEEVRLSLCLCHCSPKLRTISSVGAGDQR